MSEFSGTPKNGLFVRYSLLPFPPRDLFMPFVVVCPECDAQLKSNALIAAGRTITCPSCKTKFITERDSKEIGGGSKASVSVPPAPKPKPKPSRDEEEDFDDEDDRPPVKKKAKASRDEDEDEEDERPKKKVSKNRDYEDEDENDRPKKKVSKNRDYDDDEDDDEDRPRHKKKGKKKPQKSKLPWILGLAGGGGIALLGILTLVLFLTDTFPFNKKEDKKVANNPPQDGGPNNFGQVGNTASELLKLVPVNYNSIASFDLDEIRKDPMLAEAAKGMGEAFAFGFDAANIQKVFIFGVLDDEKKNGCVILKLKPNTDMSKFDQTYGAKATTINGLKAYDLDMGLWYFADQSTLVMGKKDQLSATIGKTQTPSGLMQEVAKRTTGVFTMGAVGIDEEGPFEELLQQLSGKSNPQQKQKTIWGVVNASIKPNHAEMVETYNYENTTIAKSEHQKLTTALDSHKNNLNVLLNRIRSGQLKVDDSPEEVKMAIETAKVSINGSTITITFNQPKNPEKFSK